MSLGLKTPGIAIPSEEIIELFYTTELYSANYTRLNYLDKNDPHLLRQQREKKTLCKEKLFRNRLQPMPPNESLALSSPSAQNN